MYKLTQLDSYTIQNYINKLYKEKHYSKHYLKGILKLIKGSLKYACYTVNFINDNPAERVHIPKYDVVTGDPAHIFTQEEFEIILERFKDVPYIYYSFLTAYYTGLRVSECYALTWDNIDFEKKTLTVNKNIIKKNQHQLPKKYVITKGHSVEEWYYGTCKNPQSNRTIGIGDTLVKALKEYKKEQEEYIKFYGDAYLKHYEKEVINPHTERKEIKIVDAPAELELNLPEAKLIFVKPNGQYRGTETTRHAFKVINYELKIPCRFHDFRDTHATRLIEQGADIKAVSKRLGHSSIMTTYNIYVRVTDKMETDTVDKFEDYTNTLDIPDTKEIPFKD
jgi:integrase